MRWLRVRRTGGTVLRWFTTVTAVACLFGYTCSFGWGVQLERSFDCKGSGLTASGSDFSIGLSCGSAQLFLEKDLVAGLASEAGLSPLGLITVYEWGWRCWRAPRHTISFLPSISRDAGLFVEVPLWIPALVLGACAGLGWRAHCAFRDASRCTACGYSRMGLAADGKCPECGAVPGK
jgi:hypothetical protein